MDLSAPIVVPIGDEPVIKTDIPFHQTPEDALKLDVYRPPRLAAGDDPCPVVLMVYGDTDPEVLRGARQWGQYRSWGSFLANHGFVAVVPDHRSHQVAGLRGAAEDVVSALEFVSEHGTSYGMDLNRIGVFGLSFGVPYQLWAVSQSRRRVRALVCYYGFMDLTGFEEYLHETSNVVNEFAAATRFEEDELFPPMLIVRAGRDFEGLNNTIDSFVRKSKRHGQDLTLVELDDAQHAFDVLDDNDASRDAIWHTLDWLKSQLVL